MWGCKTPGDAHMTHMTHSTHVCNAMCTAMERHQQPQLVFTLPRVCTASRMYGHLCALTRVYMHEDACIFTCMCMLTRMCMTRMHSHTHTVTHIYVHSGMYVHSDMYASTHTCAG